ncbi:MAG: AarF/ABC1/UbiB kinase family protein [Kofleriaceae bacterium]|nr:AarF/ABC1/UbiB kinase family protein [Kofleriaceae bacterium]
MISATISSLRDSAQGVANALDQSVGLFGHLLAQVDSLVTSVRRDGQEIADTRTELLQLLSFRFDSGRQGLRASPKALRVAKTVLAIAVSYRVEMARGEFAAADVLVSAHQKRLTVLHQKHARTIRALCIECRGTFLKLGQFLSMRPDLLPAEYITEFASLRDQVPALPFDQIRPVIEAELGQSIEDLFAHVDQEAFAAASLAQVHRAKGHDGQDYALKVQIPNAADEVESDIAILRALAKALGDALPLDCAPVLNQLADSVREELDYELEAAECETLGRLLNSSEGVCIPRVEKDLSGKRVLTLEWMPGRSLDLSLAEQDEAGKRELLTRLTAIYARQILRYGYFHADPHSGNILVQEDGTLVLLDFGCCGVLSEPELAAYRTLLGALFTKNSEEIHQSFVALGFTSDSSGQEDAIVSLVDTLLAILKDDNAAKAWAANPQAAIQEMLTATQAIPGLRTPRHFVLLGRVLATLGGLIIDNADANISLLPVLMQVLSEGPAHQSS